MKKLLLVSLTILFSVTVSFAQWTSVTSPVSQTLRYVKAVNENVLWACGYAGTVIKSTDGGNTWAALTAPHADWDIYAVDALDANVAWVTGSKSLDAKIWKTTDGGTTWNEQWYNAATFGNGLKFFDANNGVAMCDPAPANEWVILSTSDGGANWNPVPQSNLPVADGANAEYGLVTTMVGKGNSVWFTAYNNVESRVYYSTDKGLTWGKTDPILPGASSRSLYVAPISETELVALSAGGLTGFSSDGGKTFNFPSTTSIGITVRSLAYVPGTTALIAVGSSGKSMISRDKGLTWTSVPATAEASTLRNTTVVSEILAIAVGENGRIYKWTGPNLPVELTSFTAKSSVGKVYLEWNTATEMNNKGFEIERKTDAGDWRVIGFKQGNGTKSEQSKYNFTDNISQLNAKAITYRLKQIDFNGTYTYSSEQSVDAGAPSQFVVNQNYPNPFNPSTSISYGLPFESSVKISVYDALGQIVSDLVNQVQAAGYYEVNWNAADASTGTYFYVIKAMPLINEKEFTSIKKMILMK